MLLLEKLANVGEDVLGGFLGLFGSRCGSFFLLLLFELALNGEHDSEEDENGESNEEEVDDGLNEETVSEDVCGGELVLEVGDVCATCEEADERHDDVIDEGGNDFTEGTADHNTDSHVDDVALCDESFEIREKFFHENSFSVCGSVRETFFEYLRQYYIMKREKNQWKNK